jgi:hypothetical protein
MGVMQNSTQKTNQRMPGRSQEVVGNEAGNGPVGATPSAKPPGTPTPPPPKKPVIQLKPKPPHH